MYDSLPLPPPAGSSHSLFFPVSSSQHHPSHSGGQTGDACVHCWKSDPLTSSRSGNQSHPGTECKERRLLPDETAVSRQTGVYGNDKPNDALVINTGCGNNKPVLKPSQSLPHKESRGQHRSQKGRSSGRMRLPL